MNERKNERRLSQKVARWFLDVMSWKLEVNYPETHKFVMIGAPHTSNWDFIYFLLLRYGSGIELNWVGKDSLFRGPLGPVMRRLGGVPVDRRARNDFVSQVIDRFNRLERFAITLAPEGTRRKTDYWRTGFYYIASGAKVPIALGFVDYKKKIIGIGPLISPSGDIQADFEMIKSFYADKTGKHPDHQGEIRLRPDLPTDRPP